MGKYLDEANVDIFTMANADRALDESITSIYTEQFSSIMGEYLAPMQVIRNRSKWYPAEISEFNTRIKSKNDFYSALKEAISIDNDRAAKSGMKTPRIVEKRLEESFNRLIIEIHMITTPSKDMFKMLFLVNNNEISMVNLYAFAEDYTYIDAARTKVGFILKCSAKEKTRVIYCQNTLFASSLFILRFHCLFSDRCICSK